MIDTIKLLLSLLAVTIIGCETSRKEANSPSETIIAESDETLSPAVVYDQFSATRIEAFGDSIIQYFIHEAGYDISNHNTTIDTSAEENFTKVRISIKTDTYKTNGIISYDLYTFHTQEEATDFYNDLKTQELILWFGLNKRPNHILLDSNRVFWHHLEHPYGHRIRDLTGIFNEVFEFKPTSANLDSVSGFTYCQCQNEEASLKGIVGRWEGRSGIKVWDKQDESSHIRRRKGLPEYRDEIEIIIEMDSISINGNKDFVEIRSSVNLPDSRYFWKYYYLEENPYALTSEMKAYLNVLKQPKSSLTLYTLKKTNNSHVKFVKLDSGIGYILFGNRLYKLTQAS